MGRNRVQILKILIIIFAAIAVSTTIHGETLIDLKLKLLSSIAHIICPKKEVKIYTADNNFISHPKNKYHLQFVKNCIHADLILTSKLNHLKNICLKKPVFVTDYSEYIHHKNLIIGALFWQKGRPVLLFIKKNLERFHVKLPPTYSIYIDKK